MTKDDKNFLIICKGNVVSHTDLNVPVALPYKCVVDRECSLVVRSRTVWAPVDEARRLVFGLQPQSL
jgi:hypothetical protein